MFLCSDLAGPAVADEVVPVSHASQEEEKDEADDDEGGWEQVVGNNKSIVTRQVCSSSW